MMKTSFMKLLISAINLLFIGITYAPSITANNPISIKTIYVNDDLGFIPTDIPSGFIILNIDFNVHCFNIIH